MTTNITRRQFLQAGGMLAAMLGLGPGAVTKLAAAMEQLAGGNAPVLWIQGLSCSGCSVSLLNSEDPGPAELITKYISLRFHSNLSAATGETCAQIINGLLEKQRGQYILAVEGAIPAGMPKACEIGGEPFARQFARAAAGAKAVVAVGACAAFGGIPAAQQNPTNAVCVRDFMKSENINTPLIVLPGCPAHPDWIVGTLAHVLKFGIPALDDQCRPKVFFNRPLHDQCPRFADYEREIFAKNFGDEGCLFKLGCMGPNTFSDCTLRQWNSGTNTCTRAGMPCIGCASQVFAIRTDLPFYRKTELQGQKA